MWLFSPHLLSIREITIVIMIPCRRNARLLVTEKYAGLYFSLKLAIASICCDDYSFEIVFVWWTKKPWLKTLFALCTFLCLTYQHLLACP